MDACQNPRYQMWCRLIPDYHCLSKTELTKAKKAIAYDMGLGHNFGLIQPTEEDMLKANPLDSFKTNEAVTITNCVFHGVGWYDTNKKEETMYNETETQRRYLSDRAHKLFWGKDDELKAHFNMTAPAPASFEQALEWLKAGKFSADENRLESYAGWAFKGDYYSGSLGDAIKWEGDPKDEAGYKAAKSNLNKAYQDLKDTIQIVQPEKALEALKDFESNTFH